MSAKKYSEVEELRTMVGTAHQESKDLEKKNVHLNTIRVNMYTSLAQERTELIGRIQRIEQRVAALGFDMPSCFRERLS